MAPIKSFRLSTVLSTTKVAVVWKLTLQYDFDFCGGWARQVGVDGLTGKSFPQITPSQVLVHHPVYDDVGVNNLRQQSICVGERPTKRQIACNRQVFKGARCKEFAFLRFVLYYRSACFKLHFSIFFLIQEHKVYLFACFLSSQMQSVSQGSPKQPICLFAFRFISPLLKQAIVKIPKEN